MKSTFFGPGKSAMKHSYDPKGSQKQPSGESAATSRGSAAAATWKSVGSTRKSQSDHFVARCSAREPTRATLRISGRAERSRRIDHGKPVSSAGSLPEVIVMSHENAPRP